jgi:hypothetical protein
MTADRRAWPLHVSNCGHLLRRDALCSHRRCTLLSREQQQWVSDYVARSAAGGTQNG